MQIIRRSHLMQRKPAQFPRQHRQRGDSEPLELIPFMIIQEFQVQIQRTMDFYIIGTLRPIQEKYAQRVGMFLQIWIGSK